MLRASNNSASAHRPLALLISILLAGFFPSRAAQAATPKQVEDALDKAIAFLHREQKNGNWEPAPPLANPHPGRATAFALLALSLSDMLNADPASKMAVDYLEHCDTSDLDTIALRCEVGKHLVVDVPRRLVRAEQRKTLATDAAILLKAVQADSGFSRYAAIAKSACDDADVLVLDADCKAIDESFRTRQAADGSWSSGTVDKLTMTTAAIAALLATNNRFHANDGCECHGNLLDANIDSGAAWIGRHFDEVYQNDSFANLRSIERIGDATGRKYFGSHDWFSEGAEYLVKNQRADGGWGSVSNTSNAILFLNHGRTSVILNKLRYDLHPANGNPTPAHWNQRPRDVPNVARWIARQVCYADFNWQIVSPDQPLEDLLDAPILYIAGDEKAEFPQASVAKVRQYVEAGGLIVANADAGSAPFAASMRTLASQCFPAYAMRELPDDSVVYRNQMFIPEKWQKRAKVESLSNGARELFLLIPEADFARDWQSQTPAVHVEAREMMADVLRYATGHLRLNKRGETFRVYTDPALHAKKTIPIARLQFNGNWDPEPGGWRRLNAIMHNALAADLDVQTVKLGGGKLTNAYKVAHLTGTSTVVLPEVAREEIRKYIAGGGTLIVDACGGDADFAKSMESELAAIFTNSALSADALPLTSECFAGEPKLERVNYRMWARRTLHMLHTPRIRGIEINGRVAVFFSAEDLSTGLVGVPVDGIYGYDVPSAAAVMQKLILHVSR